jgi:hypothetical protein
MIITTGSYNDFKTVVDEIGFPKRDDVFYNDLGVNGFYVWLFITQESVVFCNIKVTDESAFLIDFPQAISLENRLVLEG